VLNKLNRRTGKGLSWSRARVADARNKNGVAGASHAKKHNQEILSLAQAAHHCAVSDTTIRKLVEAKLLPMTQVAPWAPWEIHRADLDAEPVRGIVERLRRTGKLILRGIVSEEQPSLFRWNQQLNKEGYYERFFKLIAPPKRCTNVTAPHLDFRIPLSCRARRRNEENTA
jgi:hypothetical protein